MSLPDAWVERIFQKMFVTYGAAFLRRYEGIPIDEVRADWAHELAVFQQAGEAIRYGLEHLPADKAPTVLQFRDLCRRPTEHDTKALKLPAPPADPVMAAKVRQAFKRPADVKDPREWARRLRQRELACEQLTAFQRSAWREALAAEIPAQEAA